MKTLQEQYNLIKEGKGHKDVFLKEVKKKCIMCPAYYTSTSPFDRFCDQCRIKIKRTYL